MGYKRPRASLFARVRACARMSLIASLLVCGAALPGFASLKNPRIAKIQDAMRAKDAAAVAAFQADFSTEADPDVRAWTLRAVAAIKPGTEKARIAFFQDGLADASALVRMAAAEAFGTVKTPEAVSALTGALAGEKSAGVRMAMVGQLEGVSGAAADQAIAQALSQDNDPNVRLRAAQALRAKGKASALKAASKDADPRVRRAAR